MIPEIKTWQATDPESGGRWLVWAPTRRLARLNLAAQHIYGAWKVSRYTEGDTLPVPVDLVQPFDPDGE